jgi:hypothetical protein
MMTDATPSKKPFRIGLLLASKTVSKDIHDFVRWAQAQPYLQITHLILPANSAQNNVHGSRHFSGPPPVGRTPSLLSRILFRTIVAVEKLFLSRNAQYRDYFQRFDLSPLVPSRVEMRSLGSRGGGLNEPDAAAIKNLDLDLLIAFGTEVLLEDPLTVARLGILFVDYAEGCVRPDALAGFWETYFRMDTTAFAVRRGTSAGGRETLIRGRVGTQFYYLLNQAALRDKAIHCLETLVERAATARALPAAVPKLSLEEHRLGAPGVRQGLSYLVRMLWLTAWRTGLRAFRIESRWNVGFVRTGWRDVDHSRAVVIKNPPWRYLADPFVISREGKDFCYVEDYDIATHRGRISVYELGSDGGVFLGVALDETFHLSFPYLFEYGGNLYMCPETSGNNDIRIYRCVDFPLRWQLEKTIMKDILAVDSMLFEKDSKWWMLTNIDPLQSGDFLELHIFSANSPLDDMWKAHSQNPIYVDASCARNAGLVKDGGRLFRMAQAQGFDFYGKSVSINEIVELDENAFVEQRIRTITPTFRKGIAGTHHLHSNGSVTVFDFSRVTGPA